MNDSAALGREFEKRTQNENENEKDDGPGQMLSQSSLVSTATRKSTTSTGSNQSGSTLESVDSTDHNTKILGFYEGLGWKRIIFLPYNTLWRKILVTSISLHFYLLVYGYHFSSDETKITFYTRAGFYILVVIELMYFIDTTLAIVYMTWTSIHKLTVNIPRPIPHLVCDVFAIIPIEYIYWAVSTSTPMKLRVNIYYGLTSHSLIRIYRVYAYFSYSRNHLGSKRTAKRLLELLTYTVFVTHAASAIHFIFFCIKKDECYLPENDWTRIFSLEIEQDFHWYIISWFVTMGCFTFKVCAGGSPHILSLLLFCVVYSISFVLIYGFMLGQIVAVLAEVWQYKFAFADRIKVIKQMLRQMNVTEKVYDDILTYYQALWRKRGAVHQQSLHYELIPNILHRDLNLDIFGDAFKRSHLLKTASESFLSFLSLKIKAEFFLPGDIIYKRDKAKSKMIYLMNGVIQILTEEDDESPIISFSGGTCLGEAALVMTCVSKVEVRCATNCDALVIEKRDFFEVLKKYPDHKKMFRKLIQARLNKSKELKEIGTKGLHPTDLVQLEDNDDSTVKWFKDFFVNSAQLKNKRLLSKNHVLHFRNANTDVHRTLAYMDLYVFTEKLELTTDDVCLRTTCPYILQPNSMVLKTWDNFIVFVAAVVAIVLPYNAFFLRESTTAFRNGMLVVEIIYCVDVFIQSCTAIKTKTELIAKWKNIFFFRLSEFTFIADFIAAFPLEIMAYMIHAGGNRNFDTLLMLNKLIKLWKVERCFKEQEAKHIGMIYHLREVKHLYHLLFAIYMFGGIFYFQSCFNDDCQTPGWYNFHHTVRDPEQSTADNFTLAILYSTTVITGTSFQTVLPISINDIALTLLAYMFSFFFVIYIISSTAAMDILYSKNWSMFQEKYKEVTKNMDELKMHGNLKRRVFNYMDFCWTRDYATSLVSGRSPIFDLTPELKERVFGPALVPYFEKVPFLKGANPQLIRQLASASTCILIQPNETIIYSGEPANKAYIIMHGNCHGESSFTKNNGLTVFGPNDMFNAVEMFMKIPSINTVRTITCCHMIQIRLSTLAVVLKRFPESDLSSHLFSILTQVIDQPDVKRKNNIETIFPTIDTEDKISSWFTFSSKHYLYSPSDVEYDYPFRKLRTFSFVKLFFLKRTMVPDGSFIIRWEISRAIFAFFSAMLFPAAGALEVILFPWVVYIRYVLDATAYVDLYMRLHVAFYDHRGIIVSHPLSTAKHYLSHGFLLDLVAVFPFEQFVNITNNDLTLFYSFLFNRVFQVTRMIRLFAYGKYSKSKFCSPNILTAATFFVFGIIFCNALGGMFTLLRCKYTPNENLYDTFGKGIYCEYWKYPFDNFKFVEPISPLRVYLYNVYLATSLVTMCGLANTMMTRSDTAIAVIFVSILGFFMTKLMYAKIITASSAVYVQATTHHEKIKSLINMMKGKNISKEIQGHVTNYFEHLWKRRKAMNAFNTFSGFNFTLKEDLFLHIYAKKILDCHVFASADRSILCHMILSGHMEVFLRGSIILRPYERTDTIYFVNTGTVELIASGNVKACPPLTTGCMFGNMPDAKHYSHSLTVVAHSHVELLAMPCKVFHKQIKLNPRIQKLYNVALAKSPSDFYLYTKTDTKDVEECSLGSIRSESSSVIKQISKITCGKAMSTENQFMKAMLILQLTASYLTFFAAAYFFTHTERSVYFIVFLYLLDLVFYVRICLQFRLAYYDDLGYLVTEPEKIVARYLSVHTKIGFIYDVAAIIPIEFFALLAPESYRILVFSGLRLNRLLTVIYVLKWFWEQNNKLNVDNVYLMRFGFMFVWITLLLQVNGIAMGFLLCLDNGNCFDYMHASAYNRFIDYFYSRWFVYCMFLASSLAPSELMPNSVQSILYCIFLLVCTRLTAAFAIGGACVIVSSSCRAIAATSKKATQLLEFYTMNYVSHPLLDRLWSYLSLLWDLKRGEQVPRLMTEAPYFLKEMITSLLYGDNLQRISIFAECHEDFLRQLVACLKQNIFFPGNYITFAGDMDDNMYFIYSGEVEFLEPEEKDEEEQVKGILVEGDAFGLITGLYPHKEHSFNYKARTVVSMLILHRADWESMLESFPAVKKEIFGMSAHFDFLND